MNEVSKIEEPRWWMRGLYGGGGDD